MRLVRASSKGQRNRKLSPITGRSPGQIVVLAAVAAVALLGFASIAVDVGSLYATQRRMQTAADAASIAGANAQQSSDSSSYQTAAQDVAAADGFTNGQNGVTVTVAPPATDPGPSTNQYVEVDIQQNAPTYFMRVLGYKTMKVAVKAVAGTVNGPACIYALDPSAPQAFDLDGNFNVSASCGLVDDSSSSSALYADGNGTLTTTSMGVTGNYSAIGNVTLTPTPVTNVAPAPDPLAALQPPTVGGCSQLAATNSGGYSFSGISQSQTLTPTIWSGGVNIQGITSNITFGAGNYGNGITINGISGGTLFNPGQYQSRNVNSSGDDSILIEGDDSASFSAGSYTFCGPFVISGNNVVTLSPGLYYGGISITGNSNVTFRAGTYILAGGGLSVTGNSTLSGTGVTFYNTSGLGGYQAIDLAGNEAANFSAPTSGPLEGILFFQDRSIKGGAGSTIVGNSSSTFDGVLYFPTTALSYYGNSSGSGYTYLIADTISIVGNASVTIGNNTSSLADGAPVKSNALYQ